MCSLEKMDRKKQRQFRGAHPKRYQADVESIFSLRSRARSIGGINQRQQDLIERRSHAGSHASALSTSQRLQAMSVSARDRLAAAHKQSNFGQKRELRAARANLHEILQENEVYEDVLD